MDIELKLTESHLQTPRPESLVAPINLPFSGRDGTRTVKVEKIGTTSPGKLQDFENLGLNLHPYDVEVPELQLNGDMQKKMLESNFRHEDLCDIARDIACDKAEKAYAKARTPVLVEDTSLFVRAALPVTGPNIKAWVQATEFGDDALLEDLCLIAKRRRTQDVLPVCTLACFDGQAYAVFQGVANDCVLADGPRGTNGFGWDKIVIPNVSKQATFSSSGGLRTWAELSTEERLWEFPFRGLAIDKLRDAVL